MVLVLGLVEPSPRSSQVLHDPSVVGEHLVVLPIRIEPYVLVLPIAVHVLLPGASHHCSTS